MNPNSIQEKWKKKIEPMEGKNVTQERKYSAAHVAFKGKFITLHFLLEEYVLKSMIYFLLKELEEKWQRW